MLQQYPGPPVLIAIGFFATRDFVAKKPMAIGTGGPG